MTNKSRVETIFEKSNNCPLNHDRLPFSNIVDVPIEKIIPDNYLEENHGFLCDEILVLPEVSEVEIVRHFIELSQRSYGVDNGIYPLGSCTMKYNPKVNEMVANLEGFAHIHPYQPNKQGALKLIYELERKLSILTGMDAFSVQPAAGAHGPALCSGFAF